ncbi:hypothetical protein SHKM778_62010 [Streptomyces sp. KM77-8]|uniref:Uncharacterized protein n=1 Tax=Streptomyces haneummycinicus TaxID=3074435 RepID=A0AAT9HR80_9ACTN
MSRAELPSRRTLLAAAVVAAVAGSAGPASARTPTTGTPTIGTPAGGAPGGGSAARPVDNRAWTSYTDWRGGAADGTRAVAGDRPGLVIAKPSGTTDYTDPHTGTTTAWEYATWTSPVHRLKVPATEAIASWNAHTPKGTWLQIELKGTYSDGTDTPGTSWAAGPPATRTSGAPRWTTRATAGAASGRTRSPSTTRPPDCAWRRTGCA